MLGPARPLPVSEEFSSPDEYIESLLGFITTSVLFQRLCGGVHILDFFARSPDLYHSLLPPEWVSWMDLVGVRHLLDLILRTDLDELRGDDGSFNSTKRWHGQDRPPQSLIEYVSNVRRHSLIKDFQPLKPQPGQTDHGFKPTRIHGSIVSTIPAHITAGMTEKKIHEVDHFARFIDNLTTKIEDIHPDISDTMKVVDFGSGQNYLGRVLASVLYNKNIIGIETRTNNIQGAKALDVHAGLRQKPKSIVNKKLMKLQKYGPREGKRYQLKEYRPPAIDPTTLDSDISPANIQSEKEIPSTDVSKNNGSIQYINHWVVGGNLQPVLAAAPPSSDSTALPPVVTISLHSCGNLIHHGLRTMTANPTVKAVALVGCCYNAMTERLTASPSYKHPALALLRPDQPCQPVTGDPDGFPMSDRLAQYKSPGSPLPGINLNITSRMMAVQAPYNWGHDDSEAFFTRHFFRALLQRVFVDLGVAVCANDVTSPFKSAVSLESIASATESGRSPASTGRVLPGDPSPIIIGSLPKSAYSSFVNYVHAAADRIARLGEPPKSSPEVDVSMKDDPISPTESPSGLSTPTTLPVDTDLGNGLDRNQHRLAAAALRTLTTEQIAGYEQEYLPRRQQLACLWSLMAFSATVIEAVITTDRWAWLKEVQFQDGSRLREAWVQTVFESSMSPRNFCVVGVR